MKTAVLGLAFALTALVGTAPAHAQERWVTIENLTSETMTYFYSTHRDRSNWGADLLGASTVVPPG